MSEFTIRRTFHDVFGDKKVILGMIHMSGMNDVDRLERAMKELDIYVESGVTGVIFENYHCGYSSLISTLEKLPLEKWKSKLVYGINVLPNEYEDALALAAEYDMDFIQLDYVSGKYSGRGDTVVQLNLSKYNEARRKYPYPIVLGGVHPKYYRPLPGSHLFEDLQNAKDLCEAIVVTGTATGSETPLSKILQFRNMIGPDFPLIVGAGVTGHNIRGQLEVVNGCIIGSAFKPYGHTDRMVMAELVTPIMNIVDEFNNRDAHKAEDLERHILPSATEPRAEGIEPVLDRLSSAREAARKANFPDYLIPIMVSLLQDNELFQFPWTCADCQYFNDQLIANCEMCKNDNPHYNSEKASTLLASQNHLRFE